MFEPMLEAAESDDDAKLILADWLDEHGNPLGQIIRLSVELRRRLAEAEISDELLRKLAIQQERNVFLVELAPGQLDAGYSGVWAVDELSSETETQEMEIDGRLHHIPVERIVSLQIRRPWRVNAQSG